VTVVARRILVADDQTDILQALRLLLGDAGFDTDLVSSTDGALERVTRQPYDLLLMDLNYSRDTTSGREGLDLLDRVHAHDGTLPVVVMTGWGTIETAVEAMRRGARSFVQKPWDDATLVDVVRREIEDGAASRRRDAGAAREHDEAQQIQRALLPSTMPSLDGCTLAARWIPALGLGGDCYDVLRFAPTRFGVTIADVVGKGLPAALLMSNLQAAVRAFATETAVPHHVATAVNRLLCRNIASGKFVTFCYAIADMQTRKLAYANAGHFPPVLMRANGDLERLTNTGLVLGIAPEWMYTTGTTELCPGDRLIFFTDGITEANSPDGEEFGDAQLVSTIRAHRREPADRLADVLTAAVGRWTGGAPQDDATLIVMAVD
jgi:sigma-B regulation protein RsbU (phosphoserine phosphatase)